jgi:hypothetical protein
MEEREKETTPRGGEQLGDEGRELRYIVPDACEAGFSFWGGSCRLLSNLLLDLTEAIAPAPQRARHRDDERT